MDLLDPELLRTFLAFAESGSLAHAAETVGRTPSAVTAQMRRLEESVGEPLLSPSGRGRVLTPAGTELVGHATRILSVHREAALSLKGARIDGRISLGVTQDFAGDALSDLLRRFAATHPRVRFDLRIGRSAELARDFEAGTLDILFTLRLGPNPREIGVLREKMRWLISRQGIATPQPELPLALLDPPCGFRSAALAALEAASREYRIVAGSGSLSGIHMAVCAGIALTVRTGRWIDGQIMEADDLPPLPEAVFALCLRQESGRAPASLAEELADSLGVRR